MIRLADDEWPLAAEVYAQAFTDDPFVRDVLALPPDRTSNFFLPLLKMAHGVPGCESLALMEDGRTVAAATLLSPEWDPAPTDAMAAYDEVCRGIGLRAAFRVGRALRAAKGLPRPPGEVSHLLFLGTLAGARGRGYGTRLLKAVREIAAARRDRGVYLEVVTRNPARHLYEKAGYQVFAESPVLKEPVSVMIQIGEMDGDPGFD